MEFAFSNNELQHQRAPRGLYSKSGTGKNISAQIAAYSSALVRFNYFPGSF